MQTDDKASPFRMVLERDLPLERRSAIGWPFLI